MNIYIDGLFYKGSGIGRYYSFLLRGFVENNLQIYTQVPYKFKKDFTEEFSDILDKINVTFVDYDKFSLKGMIKQSLMLYKIKNEIDLFFYPHINIPFYPPGPIVVTIHDLRPLQGFWDRNILKKFLLIYLYKSSFSKAKKIITISKTSYNECVTKFKKSKSKLNIIYESIDNNFFTFPKADKKLLKDDYILYVGNRKKHKNLSRLIKAYALIKNQAGCKLVIAGSKDSEEDEVDREKRKLGLNEDVIEIISPTDEQLINLYDNAKAFIFPSLIEGFGLPPLEAMARGCPVAASKINIIEEICDDAAIFFDPYSIDDIAKNILKILEEKKLRDSLIDKGYDRLRFFNKDKILSDYIELFEKVANEEQRFY